MSANIRNRLSADIDVATGVEPNPCNSSASAVTEIGPRKEDHTIAPDFDTSRPSSQPSFKAAPALHKPGDQLQHSFSIEYYEELKANFLALQNEQSIKTIMFSGVATGDGATTSALNFARTLAHDQTTKVLLIDVNLRNPTLHYTCTINEDNNLAALLQNLDSSIFPFVIDSGQLSILPTGVIHTDPTSIIASKEFSELLTSARQTFDYIVLDAPPVFSSSEIRLLANKVEGIILTIRPGYTRKQIAYRAIKELEATGGNVLGIILNRRKYYIPEWLYRWL